MKKFRPKELKDQVMVITGASSGIGLATALMAGRKGARLVLNSRNAEALKEVVARITGNGGKAISVVGDISLLADIERIRDEALSAFGTIDTWVNNAGVAIYGSLLDGHYQQERKLFEINFWGTRMASKIAVDELSKHGGTLINLGSELSQVSIPVLGMYAASKHALKAFTDALRSELKSKNIPVEVSLIRPTSIATPMPEHGLDQLPEGSEPSLPSPLYHPDVAARAILECAVRPKRDVFVGISAKQSFIMSSLFPAFADMITRVRSKALKEGIVTPHSALQENLYHPSQAEGKTEGNYGRRIFKRSLYTDISTVGFRRAVRSLLSGAEKQ